MATKRNRIQAAETAPNQPGQGYVVPAGVKYARVQISQLTNVTDYTLQHYGLVDDEDAATGQSTYPAATVWPEFDTLARTKTAGFHIDVPLEGIRRWAPRVTAITTGGSPVLIMDIRYYSE